MGNYVDKTLLKKIAIRLKELRKQKNITQRELYEDTGINIGRIERGINDLSVSSLSKLCSYFEISIGDFFTKID